MSHNNKRGGKSAGGSRPASPENKLIFTSPKDTSDASQYESIWKNYQQKPKLTSDKKLTEAMEVERAMNLEKDIVQDTYGPSPKLPQDKSKNKEIENPKAVTKELSRDTSAQKIVNNVNGTSKMPVPNKEIEPTTQKDQQQSVEIPNQDKAKQSADQESQPMDIDPATDNKDLMIILIEKEKYDLFLKTEIIIQETKEGDSGEVFNVKLQPIPLKPEKVVKKGSEDSDISGNSNNRTIQVIDIPAYRQAYIKLHLSLLKP
ncbi:hypothetical protein C1646_774437 [Rhizophagus diaphanus]|nr:hypothetical protein C1646_774437 [Rhizophagus diaphanus] [Rhizophagus sp. MUCL 43196]